MSAALVITRAVVEMPADHALDVLAGLQVLLADAREQEDLVVHRQPEQDREHHHRHEADDRDQLVDAEQAAAPSPLEDHDDDPVGGADRQQVEHRRLERHQDRAEHDHQQQERQQDDRADEPGQGVPDPIGQVDERRRPSADVDHRTLRRGAGDRVGAESPHQLGRRLILRRGGGDDLDDRGIARLVRLGRRDGRHALGRLDRRRQPLQLLQRGRVVDLDRQQQRAVEPRTEPLGEQVVGPTTRLRRGRRPVVGEPELHREQRDREDDQHQGGADEVPPRMPLHLVAPSGPHAHLAGGRLRRACGLPVDAQLVDRVPREAQERGQQRDGRNDGHQDHDRRGGRHHADERDPRDPQAQEGDRDDDAREHHGLARRGGREADRVQGRPCRRAGSAGSG